MSFSKAAAFGAVVAFSALAATAAGASTYDFTVTDNSGLVASGDFNTNGGEVDSLMGSVVGSVFTGELGSMTLVANPAFPGSTDNGVFIYDNAYDGSVGSDLSKGFDLSGLLFTVGGVQYNLFNNTYGTPGGYVLYASVGGGYTTDTVNFSATEVPEPAAWALMLIGFGGLGAAMRASRKKAIAAAV